MSKPILVLNCGSSSVKYQVIDVDTEAVLAKGLAERVGQPVVGHLEHKTADGCFERDLVLVDHRGALDEITKDFAAHGPDLQSVIAVAHRCVHGGEKFRHPTVLTDACIQALEELCPLAPLHNPPAIAGIEAARQTLPHVPQVAVFDTTFFVDLAPEVYTYAIDRVVAEKYQVRKYGFHGTSHQYVSGEVSRLLGRSDLRQIVCHLGNGASLSAVADGKPINVTLGMTPLEGLVMGTRPGTLDPGIHKYLMDQAGMSIDDLDDLFNRHSGMFGLTGYSDMRDVCAQVAAGDPAAKLGWDVYVHRIVSYIGAYFVQLGRLDALTFTAGVGENNQQIRSAVCERLGALGVELDDAANAAPNTGPRVISGANSKVKVLVVPTNEELEMARLAVQLIGA